MSSQAELSSLVSNIVNGNSNSHCRLCLKYLEDDYVKFSDYVYLESFNAVTLSTLISELLGTENVEEITGVDAVCIECTTKTLETTKFLNQCRLSTSQLQNVCDNVLEAINVQVDGPVVDQALYLGITDTETKLMLMNNSGHIQGKYQDFDCNECHHSLANLGEFTEHQLQAHNLLTCSTCYETFVTDTELVFHCQSTHKIIYKCNECNHTEETEEDLKKHEVKFHYVYQCTECDKSFEGLDKLHTHQVKHSSKQKCPNCEKTYTTKVFYENHVQLCLTGLLDPHPSRRDLDKKFCCNKCGKSYSTPGGLRVHNRFQHGNAKHHECKHCGKKFTAPSYLKPHMLKHTGEKNFVCSICGKKVVSKEALLYHTRRHTGEKPYPCKYCDEKFVNASARAEHVKFKHVGPTLQCDRCPRKFVTHSFLRQHMKRHEDPSSKIYSGRNLIPPNMPGEQNMRIKIHYEE